MQAYEWSTLGSQEVEGLNPFQLKRRERIVQDRETFAAAVESISIEPLEVPQPAEDAVVGTEARLLLDLIAEGYAATRDARTAARIEEFGRDFLENADWGKREAAVRMRNELIERERLFLGLVRRGKLLAEGKGGPALRDEMQAELALAAPAVVERARDRTRIVLEKEALLAGPSTTDDARTADPRKLLKERNRLYEALLQLSGLTPVFLEWTTASAELAQVEVQLEALPRTDIEGRREALARKVELLQRQNEIRAAWYATEPDAATAAQLVDVFDRLIEVGMASLGLKGALFSERHAALGRTREMAASNPVHLWQLLDQQDALLKAIESAEPEQDYLRGLAPPPNVDAMKQALAAFQTASKAKGGQGGKGANLFKAPPKPKPKAKGKAPAKKKPGDR